MPVYINSYFCGAGLFDVGLRNAGLEVLEAYEIDEAACQTYRHNHGSHVKHVDLCEQLVLEQDMCDGMVFTYPCTKYSTIADIHGTRTGDELFLHALRHLAIAQPEFYIVENVPGMRKFPVVMEAMTQLPDYEVQVLCPVKANLWLPQNRDRVIIVGTRRAFSIRPPTNHKAVPLRDIIERNAQVTVPGAVAARLSGKYRDRPIISDPAKGDIAPTCVAHYTKDKSTRLVVDRGYPLGVRPYTVREYARLQGLPDSFHFPVSDTEAYRQIGNGVPVPFGEWVGQEMTRYMNQHFQVAD
ncbi:DNA cytosine methyltransferase [Microbulbifer agarilyticus]|uniref:DNA cytosine methyltransferase n=1 Tax=Microbulbifer agarilyticus TaxID=260552 RepID=UPI001C93B1B2|nr:DNA cytosine methyltransferase [Microbulbifer agarilyticus]MBY6212376.1 DNA cytosine methyltransferase [Microbulbifer agarilyticus]